jgi:Transcription factor WhiB
MGGCPLPVACRYGGDVVTVIPLLIPGTVPPRDWQDPTTADLDAIEHAWRNLARCQYTDPEIFFPEKGGSTAPAKKICAGCEVRAKCEDYALKNHELYGIWGGLSDRERRKLWREAA